MRMSGILHGAMRRPSRHGLVAIKTFYQEHLVGLLLIFVVPIVTSWVGLDGP